MQNYDNDEVTFRSLVDGVRPSIPKEISDLGEIYAHLGMKAGNTLSLREISDHLLGQIRSVFERATDGKAGGTDLQVVKHQLLIRHFADGTPIQPYDVFLETIRDATRQNQWKAPPLSNKEAWRTALASAAIHDQLYNGSLRHSTDLLRKFHSRQVAIAEAVKYLRSLGYDAAIHGGRVQISESIQEAIARRIESGVKRAGGLNVASNIFNALAASYDPAIERYHVARQADTVGKTRDPGVPWAFLLNICVKHLDASVRDPSKQREACEEAVKLAQAFAATFDIEPYNIFEVLFRAGEPLPRLLQELTLFDGMFTLLQGRPSTVASVLRGLFSWVDDAIARKILGASIDQIALVAEAVLHLPGSPHTPFVFTPDAIKIPGLTGVALNQVLNAFCHQAAPNQSYLLPHDQTKVDFWFRPLVQTPSGHYILLNRSWCAPALYEAVAAALRPFVRNFDGSVGIAFEVYVRRELAAHGIHVKSGIYQVGGTTGECDAVVETDDLIIFLEFKRKTLCRTSRSGQDVTIFVDLSDSLLAAMEQMAGHELVLCQQGYLDLNCKGVTERVEWRNRSVERVALSLLDFGALQSRAIVSQIMQTVQHAQISAKSPEYAKQLAKVQNRIKALAQLENQLSLHRPRAAGPPFMNCWFINLGHLAMLLDGVTSNRAFKDSLLATRHLMTGSLDLSLDHRYKQSLSNQ